MPTIRTLPPRNIGTVPGGPVMRFTHANPLGAEFEREIAPATTVVAWAGWFDPEGDAGRGLFPSDHRLWTQGLSALRGAVERIGPVLEASESVLMLRPACGLVLSDPHSVAAFLGEAPAGRVRILVDPVAMLTPAMASHAEDHIPRMLEKLGRFEACAGIVLAGGEAASADRVTHRPLDARRAIDAALLGAYRRSVFAERGVFVLTEACRALIEGGVLA